MDDDESYKAGEFLLAWIAVRSIVILPKQSEAIGKTNMESSQISTWAFLGVP